MRLNSQSESQKRRRARGEVIGGKLETLGEFPIPKKCLDKTLPWSDRGSLSNDNTKPGPNSEH